MSDREPSNNNSLAWWGISLAILSLIASVITGYVTYQQNEELNSLSRHELANDLLVSSPNMDTVIELEKSINLTIELVSNYEGAIPARIELESVSIDGQKSASNYQHRFVRSPEATLKGSDPEFLSAVFEAHKKGEFRLSYKIYYNYNQEEGYSNGTSKLWDLNLVVER